MLTIQVTCQYCHRPARLTTGAEVWPDHPHLVGKKVWKCDRDKAWVGCYADSDSPLGQLADGELRAARIKVHGAFDPIWRLMWMKKGGSREEIRSKTLGWLAGCLQVAPDKFSVGGLTYQQCLIATDACRQLFDQMRAKSSPAEIAQAEMPGALEEREAV